MEPGSEAWKGCSIPKAGLALGGGSVHAAAAQSARAQGLYEWLLGASQGAIIAILGCSRSPVDREFFFFLQRVPQQL